MESRSFKCPSCHAYESENLDSLRIHAQKRHRLPARDLYVSLFLGGAEPKCACGCGETPKFWTLQQGFAEYVRGHHSRVKNNWGHNAIAQQKSQDTRRTMHDRGEIRAWNKGETKETSQRVAEVGQTQSANFTPERRAKRAEIMTRSWETGVIVPLRGPDHSQWKGGASALQPIVRSRLHSAWTYPKLKESDFKCSRCGSPGPGLEVHHDQERFAAILQKAIAVFGEVDPTRPDDDFERKDVIADWVTRYHVDNDVSGVVLCVGCHEEAHAS